MTVHSDKGRLVLLKCESASMTVGVGALQRGWEFGGDPDDLVKVLTWRQDRRDRRLVHGTLVVALADETTRELDWQPNPPAAAVLATVPGGSGSSWLEERMTTSVIGAEAFVHLTRWYQTTAGLFQASVTAPLAQVGDRSDEMIRVLDDVEVDS